MAIVKAYHQRTKHRLQAYAAGPETLDWDAQPDPFRSWAGAPQTVLPLLADEVTATWADLHVPGRITPHPVDLASLGLLFELSLALTAWKQAGPDRWALRANPSSGNLHPTEAYVLAQGVVGLHDGLHHYEPREHVLALRAHDDAVDAAAAHVPQVWIGLTSVQWREAWKYGERAFRYCELDVGHALGALRYAAAVLGWQVQLVRGLPQAQLAALLGLDRDADFGTAEREEPELLVQIGPQVPAHAMPARSWGGASIWHGQANRLDAHPMYRWPVIDEVSKATRMSVRSDGKQLDTDASPGMPPSKAGPSELGSTPTAALSASQLIRGRRSAQHFDKRAVMPAQAFFGLLQALMPSAGLPWDCWPQSPRVHLVLYAHRIDGLRPGAYVLPRSEAGVALLMQTLQTGQAWLPVTNAPPDVPLWCLTENPALAGAVRTLSCHQAIGSDACFAVSMLAEFDEPLSTGAWHYRELFQEAGLLGQVLYLQAEAHGYRGTGIGCYFDDEVHTLLGVSHQRLQVLYHFTVGIAMTDARISTEPPYANRARLAVGAKD